MLLLLCLPVVAETSSARGGATGGLKPQWMHRMPRPTNTTFEYEAVPVSARNLESARAAFWGGVYSSAEASNGVQIVKSEKESNLRIRQGVSNGQDVDDQYLGLEQTRSIEGGSLKLYVKWIDEYWERNPDGSVSLTTLYAKSVDRQPDFDDVTLTSKYGARGLWRSAIVPGWGQFHKGSMVKGGLFLGGTAVLAGGLIYAENQRATYESKVNTRGITTSQLKTYKNKMDNFETARNVFIGATAALYIYNLVDAVVAPGARRVVVQPRRYAMVPYVTAEGGGIAMAYTF